MTSGSRSKFLILVCARCGKPRKDDTEGNDKYCQCDYKQFDL